MKSFKLFFLLAAFIFVLPQLKSQETVDTSLVRIETTDGNEYIGTILSQNSETIQFKTQNLGTINIRKSTVLSIQPIKKTEMRGQELWYENAYANTRYFFGNSGYGLPAGEGYYQNTWILFNQASIGITDNISLSAGMMPLFLFNIGGDGVTETPVWISPKFSIPVKKDKVNLGISASYFTLIGEEVGGIGLLSGVSTFGSPDKNVTVGLGWGYATDGGIADRPTVSLSILRRGKPKWAFVSENYFFATGSEALFVLSGGARYIGKKLAIDFGGFTAIATEGQEGLFVLPWLSISVPFHVGKKGTKAN